MRIQIIGDNIKLDQSIKNIIEDKLSSKLDKLLEDFNEELKTASVRIRKLSRTGKYKVNFNMWLPGKKQIFARAIHEDFVFAVVELREDLERQIKRYRGKLGIDED